MLDLSDASTTALITQIFVLILEDNACYFINRFIALLSNVLNALIYCLFSSEETSCSNFLLDWIENASLRATGGVCALSGRPCATTSFTSKWFINIIVLIVR